MLRTHLLRAKKLYTILLAALVLALTAIPHAAFAAGHAANVYVPLLPGSSRVTTAGSEPGAVYVLTNSTAGNGVALYNRAADGTLAMVDTVETGGLGTGAGLGSQGSVLISDDGRWLFAVNAGSDDVSVFSVRPDGLILTDREPSGGDHPNSVAFHKGLLYVLNSGANNNISGFTLSQDGQLTPITGSTRPLSGDAVGAAQVSFTPDGRVLVVTERTTNIIDTYTVGEDGLVSGPTSHPSSGAVPFGFAFAGQTLVVSEAAGVPGASAVSSYAVSESSFSVISGSVSTQQGAACWMAATKNGKYAYSANAASDSVSAFSVGQNGSLTLLASQAGLPGDAPIDMTVSHNSQYLYVLNRNTMDVAAFAIQADGSLIHMGNFGGLPAGSAGIAAW